jgi:hypothetical protein
MFWEVRKMEKYPKETGNKEFTEEIEINPKSLSITREFRYIPPAQLREEALDVYEVSIILTAQGKISGKNYEGEMVKVEYMVWSGRSGRGLIGEACASALQERLQEYPIVRVKGRKKDNLIQIDEILDPQISEELRKIKREKTEELLRSKIGEPDW